MGQWKNKLFVFKDEQGKEHVTTTLPAGIAKSQIQVFQASGPYRPIANAAILDDASKWMAQLENQGFKFERSSVE